MKIRLILIAVASLALWCRGQETFQITFDGPPLQPSGTSFTVQNYYEGGVWFRPIDPEAPWAGFGRRGRNPTAGWPDNGTAYLQAGLTDSLKFSFVDNSLFGVSSVELAGYSDVVPDFTVHFVGYRPDDSTAAADFTGSGLNFRTFYFGPEFTGLTRVEISTIGWSLDNLVVTIPEPSVGGLLFLAAALGGLQFFKRK